VSVTQKRLVLGHLGLLVLTKGELGRLPELNIHICENWKMEEV